MLAQVTLLVTISKVSSYTKQEHPDQYIILVATPPGMWDHILEVKRWYKRWVKVYMLWNAYGFKRGQEYDFSGSINLPLFIEKAAKVELFVSLHVCWSILCLCGVELQR